MIEEMDNFLGWGTDAHEEDWIGIVGSRFHCLAKDDMTGKLLGYHLSYSM